MGLYVVRYAIYIVCFINLQRIHKRLGVKFMNNGHSYNYFPTYFDKCSPHRKTSQTKLQFTVITSLM